MDKKALQKLIEDSNILTDKERAYWLASLSRMTPEQLERLHEILTRAAKIPWTQQLQKCFTLIAQSAQSIGNKAA